MAARVTAESVLQKISERQLQCQICMDRFKEPKMLECSHSFCSECLQLLAETDPTRQMLTCPVCRDQTSLSGRQVSQLRSDFKLISLLDEIEQHETELQSQKDIQPPSQGTVSKCSQHTDNDVIMYCESCKQLICTTCIAKDHKMHNVAELNEVVNNCKKKALEILAEVGQHHSNFNTALQDIVTSRKTLDSMFAATKAKILKKADEEIAKEVARIREEEKKLMLELDQIYKDRAKTIENAEATNNNEMTKAKNMKVRVNQLMDKVNFCENLHIIEKLLQDLKDYTEKQPKQVPHELAHLDLEEDQKSFGRLRIKEEQKLEAAACAAVRQPICKPQTKLTQKTWTLKTQITKYMNKDKQEQNFCAFDVASYCNSDFVVCDSRNRILIKIVAESFSQFNVIPTELSIKGLNPSSVTVNKNDELIVIYKEMVKIFNRNNKCLLQFKLGGWPINQQSYIAVDDNNLMAVGFSNKISLHKPDGNLIRILPAPGIGPYLTTHKQQLIYTNWDDKKLVSMDYNGAIIFSVDIRWSRRPRGVCCDKDGSIYVAICIMGGSWSGEIHHYSPDGKYIGCIIKTCHFPFGITLTPAGDLVVATDKSVQIYHHE